MQEATNIFRVLIKTLLKAGIITDRTRGNYAAYIDMAELYAESDRMVGDDIAEEGIKYPDEAERRAKLAHAVHAGGGVVTPRLRANVQPISNAPAATQSQPNRSPMRSYSVLPPRPASGRSPVTTVNPATDFFLRDHPPIAVVQRQKAEPGGARHRHAVLHAAQHRDTGMAPIVLVEIPRRHGQQARARCHRVLRGSSPGNPCPCRFQAPMPLTSTIAPGPGVKTSVSSPGTNRRFR